MAHQRAEVTTLLPPGPPPKTGPNLTRVLQSVSLAVAGGIEAGFLIDL